jgi:hypothetical protein
LKSLGKRSLGKEKYGDLLKYIVKVFTGFSCLSLGSIGEILITGLTTREFPDHLIAVWKKL